mmetsp:Transcript_1491/g.3464  ORF Transcript_1491/g.3464 Transcript_1491/m.3464 type:complete len:149 (-) Transcript_1491:290-736(-)
MATTTYRILFFLLSSCIIFCSRSASAFQATPTTSTQRVRSRGLSQLPNTSSIVLHAGFEQLPGESTTDFIKRVTAQSNELLEKQKQGQPINTEEKSKPRGKYQRIEEWDAERKANGELSWEEKVQFEGQRYGNQVRQNSILQRHLGGF